MQISNLPASNSFSSTDVLPIEINGVTYKVTGATLAAALQTLGNYLTPDNVANNLTTIAAGSVLDARQGKVLADKLDATQSDIAIIIEGNQTTHTGGVAVGEYVIVRNSTISGITDGLYKAVQAIPANTAIDSTYLAAVDGGGLNALNNNLTYVQTIVPSRSGDEINGGYIKAGKIVVVNVRVKFASDVPVNTNVFSLPDALINTNAFIAGFKDEYGQRGNIAFLRLLLNGVLTNTALGAGTYVFSGSYISNN